jgi:ppGpp synthetase/RelA/SpoT-type nucleotidyltranferase
MPAQWADEYRRQRHLYQTLAEKLAGVLTDVISSEGLDVVQIEHRAKTVDSFLGKLDRKGQKYKNPLEEVTDLAGLRVITYYLEDVDRVSKLIRREFTIDEERSGDKADELDPDRFGYRSMHFVVTLGDSRKGLPEWAALRSLKAEIQVRTATQHAWAALEHKLRYKSMDNTAPDIARRLFRLSALFELADEQFAEVKRFSEEVKEDYAQTVSRGELDVGLDTSSLEAYLNASSTAQDALAVAAEAGWTVQREPDVIDPERRQRDLGDLVRSLHAVGVARLEELDALLQRAGEASEMLRRVAEREAADPFGSGHPDGEAFPEDILNIVVFLLTRAEPEVVLEVYGGVTAQAIIDTIEAG